MQKNTTNAKIVATIGPASYSYEMIRDIIKSGASVIRLNFSHENHEKHQQTVDWARKASEELNTPIAIFQDLQGPKIRVGQLDVDSFQVNEGETLKITTEPCKGNRDLISIDYPYLHEEVEKGDRILIDDGLIALKVSKIEGKVIITEVVDGGTVKPRKGVNLPGASLKHLSSYTKKDEQDLDFAFRNNLDFVALSFVRSSGDVIALKKFMYKNYGREIPIISKIEKPEAVTDIASIIAESSVIMIARGDLGVETSSEEVPIIQKMLIRECNLAGLPVITATQMLESMMTNPRPTRAEAGDIANAILDGTSAVMLSGETAAGNYPLRAVKIMERIINYTEASLAYHRLVLDQRLNQEDIEINRRKSTTEAVGMATRELAMEIKAAYITCFTHSGSSARLISKFRPAVPIIAYSPIKQTVQRLALSWGVTPILIPHLNSIDELFEIAPNYLQTLGYIKPGDKIVITAGVPIGAPGRTNMIKVVEI
ncbi:MAG: pyruvate kinase [Sphaerochaetaceae bacterium]